MTAPGNEPRPQWVHWQEYLDREHAARFGYLAVVQAAHRELLSGPWPDREGYDTVERQAWRTYYTAGREAWNAYTRAMAVPPPPPAEPLPRRVPFPAAGTGWPGGEYDNGQRAATFHPRSQPLDEFDARQETYLAADPATRDGE